MHCKALRVWATRAALSANRRSIISLSCRCVGLQPSEVEQAAIKTIPDVDKVFILKVISGLFEHHAEEDGEEGWSQDTPCFTPFVMGNGSQVTVQSDLSMLIFMQLNDHVEKFLWTAKSFHDQPKSFPANSVKCLRPTRLYTTPYSAPCPSPGAV